MAHEAAPPSPLNRPSPSRRALLGAAAWSVPAITLATAAPAFATTPGVAATSTVLAAQAPTATITTQANGARHITGSVVINNPTTTATTGLRAIFTLPVSYLPTGTPAVSLSSTIGNWTLADFHNSGTILTVTLTPPRQLLNESTTITFTLTAQMPHLPASAPAVSVSATATNMPGNLASVSFVPGTP